MVASLPITALFAFCGLAFTIQAVIIGAIGSDAEFPEADLGGNFFQDLGELTSWFFDFLVWFFRFITFDLVPAIPWFIQYPLAITCGGSLLIFSIWITVEAVKAIGALLGGLKPF